MLRLRFVNNDINKNNKMTEFKYAPMFQLGKDETEYYLLTKEGVSVSEFEGHKILKVTPEALTRMANAAFRDVSFLLRRSHNLQVAKILRDPEASARRDSKFGQASATRRLSRRVSSRRIQRRTFATARMPPLPCTTR